MLVIDNEIQLVTVGTLDKTNYIKIGKFHIILSKFQEISRVLPKKHGLFLQEV